MTKLHQIGIFLSGVIFSMMLSVAAGQAQEYQDYLLDADLPYAVCMDTCGVLCELEELAWDGWEATANGAERGWTAVRDGAISGWEATASYASSIELPSLPTISIEGASDE